MIDNLLRSTTPWLGNVIAVGSSVLIASIKISLIVLAVRSAAPLLHRTSAAVRRLALFGVLLCALIALPAELLLRGRKFSVPLPRLPAAAPVAPEVPRASAPSIHAPVTRTPRVRSTVTVPVAPLLALVWVLGMLALAWREWRAERAIHRVCSRAVRLCGETWDEDARLACTALGVTRIPSLRISDDTDGPFVSGLFRPVVVVPRASPSWSDECRRSVLLHEFSHVAQRDLAVRAIARLTCIVYWFNPIIWWVAARVMVECERAADDLVLASGVRPSAYAATLLEAAEQMMSGIAPIRAVAFIRRSVLHERVTAIVSAAVTRRATTRSMTWATIIAGVLLGVALGCVGAARRVESVPMHTVAPQRAATSLLPRNASLARSNHKITSPQVPAPSLVPFNESAEPDIVGALIRALSDSSSHVRAAAARSLGRFEDPRIERALRAAITDDDVYVREQVDASLVRIVRASGIVRAAIK